MLTPERLAAITTLEECETNIELLGERLDGADLFTILAAIASYEDWSSLREFIETSRLARDLIEMSQSNYDEAYATLLEMAQLEDHSGTLD